MTPTIQATPRPRLAHAQLSMVRSADHKPDISSFPVEQGFSSSVRLIPFNAVPHELMFIAPAEL